LFSALCFVICHKEDMTEISPFNKWIPWGVFKINQTQKTFEQFRSSMCQCSSDTILDYSTS
jgi:hypothetical protein